MERADIPFHLMAIGFSISLVAALVFTVVAVGPRSWAEARRWWASLRPRTPEQAELVVQHIAALRRDPEMANMYFLSRFIVIAVSDSFGQLISGVLAMLPGLKFVPDRILSLPFALISLWLAAECLIAYRRITTFEAFRASMVERFSGRCSAEELDRLNGISVQQA
ncbi:hypothetical protein [Salinarimonas soli]|uniref:Uncharacterized protein n=1 Tax=Salinarimonas soli TaxID=1638099 RepID=A0A5B2VVZ7_9HYPH|nr:hypothetical protein [Salinarimonas soli]KAA2242346.1 hypothetical protein F0L46_03425 [Salinarimonas soli]